jgi:hypothetical protein
MLQRLLKHKLFYPTLAVLGIFLLLAIGYFKPILDGKTMQQGDVLQAIGMKQNVEEYRLSHDGDEPYWTMNMFSGMPAFTVHAKYEGNVLKYFQQYLFMGLPYPIGFVFGGLIGFFLLLRLFGANIFLAAGGAVAYVFFSYNVQIIDAGHTNKFITLMYAPYVLSGVRLVLRGNYLLGGILLFLFMGLEVLGGHVQMTYYLGFVVALYALLELGNALLQKQYRHLALSVVSLGLGAALGVGINAANLLPLNEYAHYSIRGPSELAQEANLSKGKGLDRDYAYGWSYGRDEELTLFIPNAKGGGSYEKMPESSELYKFLKKQGMSKGEWKQYRVPAQSIGMSSYWGDMPFTEGPYYVGAVVMFLFVIGLILVHGPIKWALLYAALLSVLLSMGGHSFGLVEGIILLAVPLLIGFTAKYIPKVHPALYGFAITCVALLVATGMSGDSPEYRITDFLFDYLPYYNKFRAPSSMLVIAALAMPWLAVLGAQALLNEETENKIRLEALYYAAGITAGIALVMALLPDAFFDFTSAEEVAKFAKADKTQKDLIEIILADRKWLLQLDALRSLGLILAAAGAFWAFLKGYLKNAAIVAGVVGALLAIDLVSIDTRYLSWGDFVRKQDFSNTLEAKEADTFIKQDKGYYRVFAFTRNPFNDAFTSYHHRSLGGYNAAKVRRYQQLIEKHLNREGNPPFTLNVLNMLNTKYILIPENAGLPGWTNLYTSRDGDRNNQNVTIARNEGSYGPAWITQDVRVVSGPDQAVDTLDGLDSRRFAVVEPADKALLKDFANDSVKASEEGILLEKAENRLMTYSYHSPKGRFVTFSEIYYPAGWKAYIDGKEAHIFHTNFVLRGLIVPAGVHKVEFKFEPEMVATSSTISYACSGILLLGLGLLIVLAVRGNKEDEGSTALADKA